MITCVHSYDAKVFEENINNLEAEGWKRASNLAVAAGTEIIFSILMEKTDQPKPTARGLKRRKRMTRRDQIEEAKRRG